MGNKLFGVDIAGEIAKAFSGQLRSGTLTKKNPGTRTVGQLTGGTKPKTTEHTFEGFVENKSVRRSGEISAEPMAVLTIIGDSVKPAAKPEVNDLAVIDSLEFEITEILAVDPAEATFECRVE